MKSAAVAIPTLGTRIEWLRLSLSAIASQRPAVSRIVLVGPASAELATIAAEYGADFIEEKGRSLASAINQGVDELLGSADFVAWIADDDVLAPGSIDAALGQLERTGAQFCYGRVRYIDEFGSSKWLLRTGKWALPYSRIGVNFVPQPGSLISSESWRQVGGLREEFSNAMDHDLFLRLAEVARYTYVRHEVASFRVHPGSISVQKASQSESDMIRSGKGRTRWLRPLARISDRLLLSLLVRIPSSPAPTVEGRPYTMAHCAGARS